MAIIAILSAMLTASVVIVKAPRFAAAVAGVFMALCVGVALAGYVLAFILNHAA